MAEFTNVTTTAPTLARIEESLARIELNLETRVPTNEIRQAIEDAFDTYGLVAQLKEVYTTQRDDLAALVELAGRLLDQERAHDATGVDERQAMNELLVQLLELGRKHVDGLYDLERAVGWRQGDAERRKAG
jgi:hypothetical protein